ncbi:MAG TPA: hypothetical protein VF690_03230 [Hymenobacter sp.]|jgi:hypothetical protein
MKSDSPTTVVVKPEPSAAGVITLLQGQAPAPLQAPARLAYNGRLDTPRLFLTPKEANYDKLQCTFEVHSEQGAVRFIGTEKSHESADIITGKLVASEAIEQFKLNTGERWTVAQLVELVKRMRPYFATQEAQVALITHLKNWSVAVLKQFEEVQNQDGNARRSVAIKVEGQMPLPFVLNLPIYKGYPKERFEVEFGVDAEAGNVKLYLDSPQLLDLLLEKKEEYIKTEVDYFTQWGCSVIYIS